MSFILGAELQGLIAANTAAIAPNFVNIQGGTFQMGATDIGDDEKPVHEVTVSPFRMGKYPVTVEEYRELVGRLGDNRFALLSGSKGTKPKVVALADSANELGRIRAGDFWGGSKIVKMKMPELDSKFGKPENKPMVVVNWYESVVHALLRGALLATEAQWEYAATCGGRTKYGTSSGELRKEEAHYHPHSQGTTAEVRTYPANGWGLYGMTGNVWEWCRDWHGAHSVASQQDPVGPANGEFRMLRGGCWSVDSPVVLRATYRFFYGPEVSSDLFGFRLVAPQDSSV